MKLGYIKNYLYYTPLNIIKASNYIKVLLGNFSIKKKSSSEVCY